MSYADTVRHNFETAHRLPHLGGKCANLHGHSWWAEVTITAPELSDRGTVIEFGPFKAALRTWIDTHLDHGVMLGAEDPLLDALAADGTKLYVFAAWNAPLGASRPGCPFELADTKDLNWPTVENVAVLLARVADRLLLGEIELQRCVAPGTTVSRVKVSETHVNAAEWTIT